MARRAELPELDDLVRRLPFPLDAVDEVGELFERWLRHESDEDDRVVVLWTYCYVRRYFLIRFARDPSYTASELEEVIELAYRRVEDGKREIEQPTRYARWVIVLCRNTFLNFVNRRIPRISVDRIAEPVQDEESLDELHESAGLIHVFGSAVGRLPEFLRPFATQRFLEGLDYDIIAQRTGKDVATVRAYCHKAIVRLKKDRRLITWITDRTGYDMPPGVS